MTHPCDYIGCEQAGIVAYAGSDVRVCLHHAFVRRQNLASMLPRSRVSMPLDAPEVIPEPVQRPSVVLTPEPDGLTWPELVAAELLAGKR